jgi:YHS domain-containing protein
LIVAVLLARPALAQSVYSARASSQLQQDAVTVDYGGARYYFSGGTWLQQVVAGYVTVSPPAGIVAPQLPPGYSVMRMGGVTYYYANGVYYAAAAGGYAVVHPPASQGSWYYCESSGAYYPYVSSCAEGWSVVSTIPPEFR